MTMRRLCAGLLIFVLALSGATQARPAQRDDKDLATTPEETREALELVEEFNKKLNETHDIAPLIKEYFVSDFTARLQQHAETLPFTLIEWKDENALPDAADLQRFYIAATNCLHLSIQLYVDADARRRDKEGEEQEPHLADVFPPAAITLMKSDPLLRKAFDEDEETETKTTEENKGGECADNCAASKDDEAHMIENAEQLHHYTALAEELAKILRAHLAAHQVSFAQKEKGAGEEAKSDEAGRFDPEKVEVFKNARVLKSEFYGYPIGTRLVCANVGLLHVELVRVDSRLRILTIYLLIDD